MHPTKKAARIAGAVYLSMVLTGPISLIYIPNKLIVRGNAAATAINVVGHESLARMWIIGDLWTHVIFICLGVALYRLLSDVNKTWARSEEHTSELQSLRHLVCRLLLEKKKSFGGPVANPWIIPVNLMTQMSDRGIAMKNPC